MKPTAFIRSSMEMLASKDRRWLALFSLAIGVALAWTYTPLFLTPLGTGMGAALFSADGSVVAFFVATALTYLADAAFGTKPRAKAALRYGVAHTAVGVVGGMLLAGASLMATPDALPFLDSLSDGIELGSTVGNANLPLTPDSGLVRTAGVAPAQAPLPRPLGGGMHGRLHGGGNHHRVRRLRVGNRCRAAHLPGAGGHAAAGPHGR